MYNNKKLDTHDFHNTRVLYHGVYDNTTMGTTSGRWRHARLRRQLIRVYRKGREGGRHGRRLRHAQVALPRVGVGDQPSNDPLLWMEHGGHRARVHASRLVPGVRLQPHTRAPYSKVVRWLARKAPFYTTAYIYC